MTGGGSGGLGLTLQQLGCTSSGSDQSLLFPCRRRMMMMMVRPNHDRAFEVGGGSGGGGGGGHSGLGPTTTGAGGAEEAVRCVSDDDHNNIYDVGGGGGRVVVKTTLTPPPLQQPFHISTTTAASAGATTATTTTPTRTFKSPGTGAGAGAGAGSGAGGMMAASLGFPFTTVQWKELERQAMIYKYMMASVPVPPELLFPITRNFSDSSSSAVSASSPHSTLGRGSIFNLRFTNGSDPEPGRCRRTDGKKWRCSRDVAPNQKYCERHMHRGRPRSRKPVEPHTDLNNNYSHKKTRHSHPPLPLPATHSNPIMIPNPYPPQSQYLGSALDPFHQTSPVFLYKSDTKASPFPPLVTVPSFKDTRGLEWTAKGGGGGGAPVAASDQQWQQLMQTKIGLTLESSGSICNSGSPVYNQQYQEEPINLNSYTDFNGGADHHPGRCSSNNNMFLNPEIVPLQKTQAETPRAFIDAWSSAVTENPPSTCNKTTPISSDGKLPLSSLTLTMGGGNGIEDEMGSRLGEAAGCSSRSGGEKPELSTWLTPAPWAAGSAPGGPLAEVLRPSSAAASSNPGSPQGGGNGGSISPSETAASSPSGVLQKPVVSPTSSGNSSPTHISGSQARAENTFPWLSQSKAAASGSSQ